MELLSQRLTASANLGLVLKVFSFCTVLSRPRMLSVSEDAPLETEKSTTLSKAMELTYFSVYNHGYLVSDFVSTLQKSRL